MMHAMKLNNKLTFFDPSVPHESIVEIVFSEDKLSITVNGKESNSFSLSLCELKVLLHFLSSRCSSDIYQLSHKNQSIKSYTEMIKRLIINISLCHTLEDTVEIINESCIETALTILQQSDYSLEYV